MVSTALTTGRPGRPLLEVADIFRLYGAEYRRRYRMSLAQRRVMGAIVACRTAALGAHSIEKCDTCGALQIAYNSCRNRHCPKCQGLRKQKWLEARIADLLPVPYFHVVFTLPHQINQVLRLGDRLVFDALFGAASKTLLEFGREELHGTLGFSAILHTWGQTLVKHVHLHCIVTGGALSSDQSRWTSSHPQYLFNVRQLSARFRDHFLALYKKALPASAVAEADAVLTPLSDKEWVVFSKAPFSSPQTVLEYISRYSHRVAITNSRLLSLDQDHVVFQYRDYRDNNTLKTMRLHVFLFMRRFLQHVLPPGYMKVRHFGLLAGQGKTARLARCRELLPATQPATVPDTARDFLARLLGDDFNRCPFCALGHMRLEKLFKPPWANYPPAKSVA